jgi:hypothetical protein
MWGENAPPEERNSQVPPWWHFGWHGTPYGDQCQDGGAILYNSYFDLMVRLRYFGIENAWKTVRRDSFTLPNARPPVRGTASLSG